MGHAGSRRLIGLLLLAWLTCGSPLAAWAQARSAAPVACPPAPQPLSAAQQEDQRPTAPDRGFLWRLTRDGHSSHLFGTMHVGRPEWTLPGPRLRAALAASDSLAVELDLSDADTLRELQAGTAALRDTVPLPARTRDRLTRAAARACLPPGAWDGQPAALRAITLALLDARWEGLDPAFQQEAVLGELARTRGLPVIGLEKPRTQLAALLSQDRAERLRLLDQALDQLDSGALRRVARRLADAWSGGRLDELATYERWCECLDTAADRAWLRRVNDERNLDMAARIESLHADGRRLLVAVGALHMTGPQALTTLLEQRGFVVERLVSPTP